MAIHIELRRDLSANWSSTNPVLAQGEVGVTTDTGQVKIGDGISTWNALSLQGTAGPTQTTPYYSLGIGSDGNVTISSGTTVLTRDMYYNNLTINGSGVLSTVGYKVYVLNILDINNAQAGAIQANANSGGNASVSTGGILPTVQTPGSVGIGTIGTVGITGGLAAGGISGGPVGGQNGGGSQNMSSGGAGSNGAGGNNGGAGGHQVASPIPSPYFISSFLYSGTLIGGGSGGNGGGAGGGDGTNAGGGSGAGGSGGDNLVVFANSIVKGPNTPASVFQTNGGTGGNGGTPAAGNCGGGAGGGGGGGGWLYLAYYNLYGPIVTNLLQANGSNGGTGGNGTGTGIGGTGGTGGSAGRIDVINLTTNIGIDIQGPSSFTLQSQEVSGNPPLGILGGNGGYGGQTNFSL